MAADKNAASKTVVDVASLPAVELPVTMAIALGRHEEWLRSASASPAVSPTPRPDERSSRG